MAEWISVNSEEKPENKEAVLAYVAQTNNYHIAVYDKDGDYFYSDMALWKTYPTHWKRLEPPKGE